MSVYPWVTAALAAINDRIMLVGPWVDSHQPLTGAAIGFGGVILTLLWNARQSRRSEAVKTNQQRTALLAAFYAELAAAESIIGQALIYMVKEKFLYEWSKPMESMMDSTYMFQTCPRTVFEKNADKLGQLGRKLSHSIVEAYSSVAEFESVISIFTSPLPQNLRERKVSGNDAVHGVDFVAKAKDAIARALADIKQALPKAERHGLLMLPAWGVSDFVTTKREPAVSESDDKAPPSPETRS